MKNTTVSSLRKRHYLALESLESRCLLAANLLIDFGYALGTGQNDTLILNPNPQYNLPSLASSVTLRQFNTYDFDGDGQVDAEDTSAFADSVVAHVQEIFEPFEINVQRLDAQSQAEVVSALAQNSDNNDVYAFVGIISSNPTFSACGVSTIESGTPNDDVTIIMLDDYPVGQNLYPSIEGSPAGGTHNSEFSRRFALAAANVVAHELIHTNLGLNDSGLTSSRRFYRENGNAIAADEEAAFGIFGYDQLCEDDGIVPPLGKDRSMVQRFRNDPSGLADGELYYPTNEYDLLVQSVGKKANVDYIGGTGLDDEITVTSGGSNTVNVSVKPIAPNYVNSAQNLTAYTYSINTTGIDTLYIDSGHGEDVIDIDPAISGIDFIVRTAAGDDTLESSSGIDRLEGGSGQDKYIVLDAASVESDPKDTIVDELIRNDKGLGDFDGDLLGDANKVTRGSQGGGWIAIEFTYDDYDNQSGVLTFNHNAIANAETKLMEAVIDEMFRVKDGPFDSHAAQFDFDDDGDVDGVNTSGTDVFIFIEEILGTFFGDATLDGRVNEADLNVVGVHWQQSAVLEHWGIGDMNGDGIIDEADLNMVGVNWQQSNGNWSQP